MVQTSLISQSRRGNHGCGANHSHAHTQRNLECSAQVCAVTASDSAEGGARVLEDGSHYEVKSSNILGAGRSPGAIIVSNVKSAQSVISTAHIKTRPYSGLVGP